MAANKSRKDCFCSFCGKGHAEVSKLIAGPGVFICNECVDVCTDILAEEMPGRAKRQSSSGDPFRAICGLLLAMRDADEIPESVFSSRVIEARVRHVAPEPKPPAIGGPKPGRCSDCPGRESTPDRRIRYFPRTSDMSDTA